MKHSKPRRRMFPSELRVGMYQLDDGTWECEAWNESDEWRAVDLGPLEAQRQVYRAMKKSGACKAYLDKIERIAKDETLVRFYRIMGEKSASRQDR